MPEEIQKGSKVKYSAKFLRSIGTCTGDICFAKGEVKEIKHGIAEISWDKPDLPKRVNVFNLVDVNAIELA